MGNIIPTFFISAIAAVISSLTYYFTGLAKKGDKGKEVPSLSPAARIGISTAVGAVATVIIVLIYNRATAPAPKQVYTPTGQTAYKEPSSSMEMQHFVVPAKALQPAGRVPRS